MKKWFRFFSPGIFSLMVLVLVTVSITSCNDDDDAPIATQNIVALAQSQPNLSSLVTALTKYPDLVTLLSGSGNFTVFAPTNAAFNELLATVGQSSINDLTEDVLKDVLQYHVVTTSAVFSTQLEAGNVPTANGESIAVTTSGGIRFNTNTQVVTPDVRATNGVVHIVDKVLVPPSIVPIINTVVEYPYFNKNFTTLIAAVLAADEDILALLLDNTKKTLFAPNNDAFVAAGITSLPAESVLNTVLPYHVIGSEVRAANLPTNTAPGNSAIETLGGKFYLSNRGTQGVFINGSTQVTQTNILADNGVVHVINRTLMPPSQTIAQIVTASAAANPAQFTKLLQALSRTEAASLLTTAGNASANLTVFAPTDAAFAASGINLTTVDGAELVGVLEKHIISAPTTSTGRIFSRDLFTGNAETLNGNVAINATALTVTSGGVVANIVTTTPGLINILGTNGVVHAIDKVLLP